MRARAARAHTHIARARPPSFCGGAQVGGGGGGGCDDASRARYYAPWCGTAAVRRAIAGAAAGRRDRIISRREWAQVDDTM